MLKSGTVPAFSRSKGYPVRVKRHSPPFKLVGGIYIGTLEYLVVEHYCARDCSFHCLTLLTAVSLWLNRGLYGCGLSQGRGGGEGRLPGPTASHPAGQGQREGLCCLVVFNAFTDFP